MTNSILIGNYYRSCLQNSMIIVCPFCTYPLLYHYGSFFLVVRASNYYYYFLYTYYCPCNTIFLVSMIIRSVSKVDKWALKNLPIKVSVLGFSNFISSFNVLCLIVSFDSSSVICELLLLLSQTSTNFGIEKIVTQLLVSLLHIKKKN